MCCFIVSVYLCHLVGCVFMYYLLVLIKPVHSCAVHGAWNCIELLTLGFRIILPVLLAILVSEVGLACAR